jgi:hypothetical protein
LVESCLSLLGKKLTKRRKFSKLLRAKTWWQM